MAHLSHVVLFLLLAIPGAANLTIPQQIALGRRRQTALSSPEWSLANLNAALKIKARAKPKTERKARQIGGTATIAASIFNLVNNVAGAGILALPAGQASGTGWIPAMLICGGLGAISARTFVMVGEACEITGEQDFKGLWARTIGPKSTYVVDAMISILCLACAVIYSGILGDVFTPLLHEAGLPPAINGRTSNIILVTLSLLLPLSLIKDLSVLAFTSILGFSAIAYTVWFIVWRALDGSYKLGAGRFVTGTNALAVLPAFTKSSLSNLDFTSLVLASSLGLAYVAHYNAPNYYRQLKNTNSRRFGKMVYWAFAGLFLLYQITMMAGYSTFGDVCKGNILLSYHPKDVLATLGRLATGFSILFGFPLITTGAREGLVGVASSFGKKLNETWLMLGILTFVTMVSCTVKDVSFVVSLTGAAMGSFIVYIFPTLIYTKAMRLRFGLDSPQYRRARYNLLMVPLGLFLGAFGVYMTLKGA